MLAIIGLVIFFGGIVLDVILPQNSCNRRLRDLIYLSPAIGGLIAIIGFAPFITLGH